MTLRFAGKPVLVTGGSRGIVRAIVERLAREGAHVAVNRRTRPWFDQAACDPSSAGPRRRLPDHCQDKSGDPALFLYRFAKSRSRTSQPLACEVFRISEQNCRVRASQHSKPLSNTEATGIFLADQRVVGTLQPFSCSEAHMYEAATTTVTKPRRMSWFETAITAGGVPNKRWNCPPPSDRKSASAALGESLSDAVSAALAVTSNKAQQRGITITAHVADQRLTAVQRRSAAAKVALLLARTLSAAANKTAIVCRASADGDELRLLLSLNCAGHGKSSCEQVDEYWTLSLAVDLPSKD